MKAADPAHERPDADRAASDVVAFPASLLEEAATTLRVLAHAERLRIVACLVERLVPVGELAACLGLPPAAVSQHLNKMRAHGIVAPRRDGRRVLYEVVDANALALIECLRRHCSLPASHPAQPQDTSDSEE